MSSRIYSVSFPDWAQSHLVEGCLGLGLGLVHGIGLGL